MIGFLIVTYVYTRYLFSDKCKLSDNKDNKINEDLYGCGKDKCTLVTPSSDSHLFWAWTNAKSNKIYYPFFLLSFNLLAINGLEHGYHAAGIITGSFAISNLIYADSKSVGAMWCYIAAFIPWITPFVYKIEI